jgi:hypothetical protein
MPLALFGLVMTGWVGVRAMVWESPAALPAASSPQAVLPAPAVADAAPADRIPQAAITARPFAAPVAAPLPRAARASSAGARAPRPPQPRTMPAAAHLASGAAAFALPDPPAPAPRRAGASPVRPDQPLPPLAAPGAKRWSLDAWAFYREGSDTAPISQGRVPIYGASQIGTIAQFRVLPSSRHDPRLYVRAYRALIARGETEGAVGGSIRPIASLPLRAFAELRYTDGPFANEVRPSLFVVSELPPQALPADFTLEAYGQAGWVGGNFATPFADGQVSLARELARFTAPGGVPLRVSAGAGAWGGAQKDAQRLDVGPTMRLEWSMGRVPARLSIDWRERVAGDAAPESGLAATLSTSF